MRHYKFLTLALLSTIWVSCDQSKEKVIQLETQSAEQLAEIEYLKSKSDSLIEVAHKLEGKMEALENATAPIPPSAPEQQIHKLVLKLHKGWEVLASEKNADQFLNLFLSKYTTNGVNIDTANVPSVARHNNRNFEEHVRSIADVDGLRVSFGNNEFYYTVIKGDKFVTCYRSLMRVYIHNKIVETKSVITLLAGQKKEEWKVGSYSWVTLDYK